MPPEIVELRKSVRMRAMTDFPWFARHILKIRTKNRGIVPFELNRAQRHVHETLERQRRETGKVRAIILKARQEGISTYIEGRFYHKTIFNEGVRTFILTHQEEATKNIFEMVDLFHERCHPDLRPLAGKAFSQESLECRYCDYRILCWNPTEHIQTVGQCKNCAWLQWDGLSPVCSHRNHSFPVRHLDRKCDDWSLALFVKTPFIKEDGTLVIPFDSHPRYQWWNVRSFPEIIFPYSRASCDDVRCLAFGSLAYAPCLRNISPTPSAMA